MECHKADELMMKYMDNTLSTAEAQALSEHLKDCACCEADFRLYDGILTGFSQLELVSAPDGFEERVMEQVRALPHTFAKRGQVADNILCLVWGMFSVLFGLGLLLTLNRDVIMEYIYSEPSLAAYARALTAFIEPVAVFSGSMALVARQMLTSVVGYASASRYILLAILAVLAVVQLIIHRRGAKGHAE